MPVWAANVASHRMPQGVWSLEVSPASAETSSKQHGFGFRVQNFQNKRVPFRGTYDTDWTNTLNQGKKDSHPLRNARHGTLTYI